ncbi:MAG: hypothetical protein WCG83_06630 [Candidatus Peregrinibacteria bacterium]
MLDTSYGIARREGQTFIVDAQGKPLSPAFLSVEVYDVLQPDSRNLIGKSIQRFRDLLYFGEKSETETPATGEYFVLGVSDNIEGVKAADEQEEQRSHRELVRNQEGARLSLARLLDEEGNVRWNHSAEDLRSFVHDAEHVRRGGRTQWQREREDDPRTTQTKLKTLILSNGGYIDGLREPLRTPIYDTRLQQFILRKGASFAIVDPMTGQPAHKEFFHTIELLKDGVYYGCLGASETPIAFTSPLPKVKKRDLPL